jgi:1-acyl-sn-glycerol-3-phosphate acyltransferase
MEGILPDTGRRTLRALGHDLLVTLACWGYFLLAFVLVFWPFYLGALLLPGRRETRFQRLNNLYYRGFFRLLKTIAPAQQWEIDPAVRAIRGAVVVANHLSYLDPLLMQALFPRHKTVVKTGFFRVPIFGWVLWQAGYFPAGGRGRYRQAMIDQVEGLTQFLDRGGVFFIFPEGHRSRTGQVGALERGAIKIARLCRAPIEVLRLDGTGYLFPPGRMLFNAATANTIRLKRVATIDPGQVSSLTELEGTIKQALAKPGNGASR